MVQKKSAEEGNCVAHKLVGEWRQEAIDEGSAGSRALG